MAITQTQQIRIDGVTAAQLHDWHTRPGAVTRLTPATLGSVTTPSEGLAVGATTGFRVGPNPLAGLGFSVGVPWTARLVQRPIDWSYGFVDEQVQGPFRYWRHEHEFRDTDGGAVVRDTITWQLPTPLDVGLIERQIRAQVQRMLAYRARQLTDDFAFHVQHSFPRPSQTIAVTGASGLVGRQLCAFLSTGGHTVRRMVRRSPASPDEIAWDPTTGALEPESLRDVDTVIHLAGEPIGRRFSPAHKEKVLQSRTESTSLLAHTVAKLADDGRHRSLISSSGIGWYGTASATGKDYGDQELTEDLPSGAGFLAEVCRQWEASVQPATDAGVRTAMVRTGIVQSAAGGVLGLQLPLFLAGLGGPLGSGEQWQSWIALDDLVELYALLVSNPELTGPINGVAPHPVRNKEFTATLAQVVGRPAILPVPALGPAVLLGSEGATELALASARVSAARAQQWGVEFRYPDLESALRHELCR